MCMCNNNSIRLFATNVSTAQVAIMMEWTQSLSHSGLYYASFVAQLDLDKRTPGTAY